MEKKYKVLRFYEDGRTPKVMRKNLTLKQAREECGDPETSSRTAYRKKSGVSCHWFHGYTEQ